MKKNLWPLAVFCLLLFNQSLQAQGPPITANGPIMLNKGNILLKTLAEIRNTDQGTFTKVPVMFHYLPTSNSVVSVHLPMVTYDFESGKNGTAFGDLQIMGKYQFYRNDGKGKSFRIAAMTLQTLPTGEKLGIEDMSTGNYEGYYGIVAGYETLKHGISSEIAYNMAPEDMTDKFEINLGFGLPLLEPTYPVNQLNLYFEYDNEIYTEFDGYRLLFAQGIQYARDQWTFEAAVQVPLVQDVIPGVERNYSIFLGTRYVF